jgi:glycosyl transferase family 25
MEHFKNIVYINLDHRIDRNNNIIQQLKPYKKNNIIRLGASYYKQNGPKGCALSHIRILEMAIKNNWDNVLILEDDFIFTQSTNNINCLINKFFCDNVVWDIIMFSSNLIKFNKYNDYLNNVIEGKTTSGYAVNNTFFKVLLLKFKQCFNKLNVPVYNKNLKHFCIDMGWRELQLNSNWYIFNPKIGKQKDGYSDILHKYKNYDC